MKPEDKKVSRRRLLTTAGAAAAVPLISPAAALGQGPAGPGGEAPGQGGPGGQGPGQGGPGGQGGGTIGAQLVGRYSLVDRIEMAGIGLGNRGQGDLRQLLGDSRVQFVAIADPREERREAVKSIVDEHYGNNDCVTYKDTAELLARDDVEALLIATSDRWHAHMACWAAQSGKHFYEEKPAAQSIAQAFTMAENCTRYGTIYQSGCQRRNQFSFEFAVGLARSGMLGRLLAVHADTSIESGAVDTYGHSWLAAEPDPDPDIVNYDVWLGPVLYRPYSEQILGGARNQFSDTHTGLLEWGSHTIAAAQWAADMEDTEPVEYVPEGHDVRVDGLRNKYTITCTYANGVKLIIRNHSWLGLGSCGNRFEGTEGWVETGDGGNIEVSDNLKHLVPTTQGERYDATLKHLTEFLDCLRSRKQTRANAVATCHTHVAAHAALIAAQLNRTVRWDPAKREFINDDEANRMRSRAHRAPYRMESIATSM